MDLLQTVAFLQWLMNEPPFAEWRQEGFELRAWIEANGFDPGLVLAGIRELERANKITRGLEDLVSGTASLAAQNNWIRSTKDFLAQQNALAQNAGGTGSTLGQISKDYRKSLVNINNHTDQQISKEIQARIEERLENRIIDKLDKEIPKYADEWSAGATAAKQDYNNKAISQHQKEILSAHGITTNKWYEYGMYSYTKGFEINFRNGGYISIEKYGHY